MEYIKIHMVLGALRKSPKQYKIEVEKIHSTQREILERFQMQKHPDIEAGFVKVVGGWPGDAQEYIRIVPGGYGYSWDIATKKYGFVPREAVGEEPSDHVLYVENRPAKIKSFVSKFERLTKDMPRTRFYVKEMVKKIYAITIGADKLSDNDQEALLNL